MYDSSMGVRVTAYVQQRGTSSRDEAERPSRVIEVRATTFADGKQLVGDQVPAGWVVASWRVDRE